MRRQASPTNRAGEAKLIKPLGIIIGNAMREYVTLPGVGGNFKSLQLTNDLKRSAFTLQLGSRRDVLPAQQPPHELRRGDRLNLLAKRGDCEAMNAS